MINLSKDYESIFSNIDGFFVIDENEKVVYMADNLIHQIHKKSLDDVVGKSIRDLIPTNNTYNILRTGKNQIGEMYFVEGYTIVSNGYPIYKDGELIGAFEYDVFSNIGFIEEFLEKTDNVGDIKNAGIKRRSHEYRRARYSIDDIKGSGPAISSLKEQIEAAAKSNSTVLITGETGCGKELVAHAIHQASQRSLFHFVRLNCASIPAELFESELFGYEEGSFTGAKKGGKYGKAEIANNGTLFLDEIDNLTLNMQAKILRFLQEKEVYHVGGDFAVPVNTRIIAATNQEPEELIKSNRMRKDLYYRLNVIEIKVPPLRNRREDIPEIAAAMVENFNNELERGKHIEKIDPEIYPTLMAYDWPGNVRELGNVVERAINRCYGDVLKAEHFADFTKGTVLEENRTLFLGDRRKLKDIKEEAEAYAISSAMLRSQNNITQAAEELGISRQMLHRKLKEQRNRRKQKFTGWNRT